MSEPHAENDADAGLLLHELRNVNANEYEDEDEIEREQRERMPDIAFIRQESQMRATKKIYRLVNYHVEINYIHSLILSGGH